MPTPRPHRWWYSLLLGSLIASLLLSLPVPSWANMAPPQFPPQLAGEIGGEPIGDFQALSIVEELLLFDLRPLDQDDGDQRINFAQITLLPLDQSPLTSQKRTKNL